MSEEIELKFYIDSTDNVELISDTVENALKDYQIECKGTQKLANAYYDTKDLILKNLNMGVRVRSVDDKFHEQTAKCSGIVIGGLHKRVEYNVPVETPVPDLKKFPTVMWKDQDVELLQHNIEKKFETNFKRKLWHIKQNDQLIAEICFDQGVVETKDQKEAINEIEIERLTKETICFNFCLSSVLRAFRLSVSFFISALISVIFFFHTLSFFLNSISKYFRILFEMWL